MPNPFLRTHAAKTSMDPTDRERPSGAIEPVPESVVGTVFAYRGQETHGVATTTPAVGVADDNWEREADYDPEYEDPEKTVEPIPVRVVSDGSVEIRRSTFSMGSATGTDKGGQATQLVGNDFANRTRTRVRVRNNGATVIYLGHEPRVANAMFGWPLAANETFESASHEALWALGSVATETPVSVYTEFAVVVTHK